MKKNTVRLDRYISRMALSGLIVSLSILPVQAFQGQYSAFNDTHGLRSSLNAGFRLRMPFGPSKKSEDKVKYGFQINLRREFNNEFNNMGWTDYGHMTTARTFDADIISLDFSENGFKGLSLVGQQTLIYKDGGLMAAEGQDKKGSGKGWYIAGGIVFVIMGTGLVWAIARGNQF